MRFGSEPFEEEELAARLRRGDADAMGELYDRFGAGVYAIALRIVRNPATAEDLTQETFIRVWNGIHLFDERRGSLGAWVGAVARNRVLDYLRSADFRSGSLACDLVRAERHAAREEPGSQDDEISRELARALASLTENHRRVLELAYVEGLTHNEIAARIHRPLGTVKTWARVALQTLRVSCKTGAARSL